MAKSKEYEVVSAGGKSMGACLKSGCDYRTDGWDTAALAEKRIKQHIREHETGEAMQDLAEFMAANA